MKNRYVLIVALCALLLTGCSWWKVTVQHLGKSYPVVSTIDVFYAEKDIKTAQYEYVGEVFLYVGGFVTPELKVCLLRQASSEAQVLF